MQIGGEGGVGQLRAVDGDGDIGFGGQRHGQIVAGVDGDGVNGAAHAGAVAGRLSHQQQLVVAGGNAGGMNGRYQPAPVHANCPIIRGVDGNQEVAAARLAELGVKGHVLAHVNSRRGWIDTDVEGGNGRGPHRRQVHLIPRYRGDVAEQLLRQFDGLAGGVGEELFDAAGGHRTNLRRQGRPRSRRGRSAPAP